MAWLQSLKIQGLRNISQAELQPFSRFNIFHGANGAGKTTLLEAIHLLGLGRSFRMARHKPLISHDTQEAVVFGQVLSGAHDLASSSPLTTSIGVSRDRKGVNELRIRGQRANSNAELAALFPLQVIHADTFQLILGSPVLRRQFLDWGVFHVEQSFLDQWRRLQRCVKQRNSLLRRGKIGAAEFAPWDAEFVQLSESVTSLRQQYFELWLPVLLEMMQTLWPEGENLSISFYPGWDRKIDLAELIHRQLPRDRECGYTTYGPHRADMRFRLEGMPAGEVLSRGQLKLLSASMRLAQAAVMQAEQKKRCVFLVDDLPSELDQSHRAQLCRLLSDLGSQLFVTAIDQQGLANSGFNQRELSVFHVEHGSVTYNGERE